MFKNLTFFYGNHRNPLVLNDYKEILEDLKIKNCKIVPDKKLNKTTDGIIIIEEFSNPFFFNKLKKFLHSYKKKKILIITEFIENDSFNNFTNQKLLLKDVIKKYYFISWLAYKIFFKFIALLRITILDFVLSKNNKILIYNFLHNLNEKYYYYFRYVNFLKIYQLFDLFLVSHPNINCKNISSEKIFQLPFLPNEVNFTYSTDKKKIIFSGQINKYRQNLISGFIKNNNYFNADFMYSLIKDNKNFLPAFIDNDNLVEDFQFALHIKKFKEWKYVSPVRFLNSFKKNQIPCLIEHYDDNLSIFALNLKNLILVKNSQEKDKIIQDYIENFKVLHKKENVKKIKLIDALLK